MGEEKEDIKQFFKDWGATAEQTVRELRSLAESHSSFIQKMLTPLPWLADSNKRLRGYLEQDFDAAIEFVQQVTQAADIKDVTGIYVAYIQKCVELFAAQARDFAEAYIDVARDTKACSRYSPE